MPTAGHAASAARRRHHGQVKLQCRRPLAATCWLEREWAEQPRRLPTRRRRLARRNCDLAFKPAPPHGVCARLRVLIEFAQTGLRVDETLDRARV
eukprot:scaffold249884_cov26-Tisochrysis_lutea.AAC.2